MTTTDEKIEAFLQQPAFAVAGASTNREKYGNKVLRVYLQHDRVVYPLNPKASEIEGAQAYPNVAALPDDTAALSIVTPGPITRVIVKAALERGIRHFWMQPGAQDDGAIAMAEAAGATVIHSGPCALVVLGYNDAWTPNQS